MITELRSSDLRETRPGSLPAVPSANGDWVFRFITDSLFRSGFSVRGARFSQTERAKTDRPYRYAQMERYPQEDHARPAPHWKAGPVALGFRGPTTRTVPGRLPQGRDLRKHQVPQLGFETLGRRVTRSQFR